MIIPEAIHGNFPSLQEKTYLNTAAEGIPPLVVGQALTKYWEDKLLGMDGRDSHFAQEAQARGRAAQLLHLETEEVAFCSCSSEAYNLLSSAMRLTEGDEVVISDIDFPSGFTPWLQGNSPASTRLWKSRHGALEVSDLAELLNPQTRLVQVSLVSFYNGFRLPWEDFLSVVREKAPEAVVSVDLTQALGRCDLDCTGADIMISSTHKWLLGTHGSCVVGVPARAANRLTTTAGGWYHIRNAFDADRFEKVDKKSGAASFSVGMPSFAPIYALNAAMAFLLSVGIPAIAAHSDPLVQAVHAGLTELGIKPMAPPTSSGIVAFQHPDSERLNQALHQQNIHLMHQAGRMRVAIHGYNTLSDVEKFLRALTILIK